MSQFRTNVSIYVISNIIVALIPFILMPILTRYLGAEGYGIVAMFTTLITLLSPVIGLNVHNGLSRRWFDQELFNIAEYVSACIAVLLGSALLVSLVFWSLKTWFSALLSIPIFWLFVAIAVAVSVFLIQLRLVLWQVQERPIFYGCLQFGLAVLNALLSYVLILYFFNNFEGRLWGYTVASLVCALLSLFLLYKEALLSSKLRWNYMKDALAFGVPLIPHVVGAIFLLMADRMIVNIKLGTSNAGIYMVAVQIALGFNLLNESFNKAFIPRLFAILKSGDISQKMSIIKWTYTYFALLLMVPMAGLFLSKYLVLLLAGPDFKEAIPVLNWLILTQSFQGMYYLVTNYLFYECKTYITSAITLGCGSISIILVLCLVNSFGLVGAGMGSAIGMLLQFILTWVMAIRIHPMPWFTLKFKTLRLINDK